MTIIDLLERNALQKGNEVALVELNPELLETRRHTWREFELVEPATRGGYFLFQLHAIIQYPGICQGTSGVFHA